MTDQKQRELLALLGSLCNGTLADEEAQILNQLLTDDVDARNLYRDYLQVHLVLVEQVRNEAACGDETPAAMATAIAEELAANVESEVDTAQGREIMSSSFLSEIRRALRNATSAVSLQKSLAIAAGIAIVFAGLSYLLWSGVDAIRPADDRQLAAENLSDHPQFHTLLNDKSCNELLVVRDSQALRMVSQLTRTGALASLQLPSKSLINNAEYVTLCSGAAWMERSAGYRERGYVVGLPPTCSLRMYVDTNAAGQNALSVIQLDDHGSMIGGAMSFNNLVDAKAKPVVTKQLGCIGNYRDFNGGLSTKYYLLTGSYNDPELTADNTWSQSDYKVQFRSNDVLVIGWDDTRYIPPLADETTEDHKHDCDFNDMRAIIRLVDSEAIVRKQNEDVEYSPPAIVDEPTSSPHDLPETGNGSEYEVAPSEVLVLIVSSSATTDTAVQIRDAGSRKVVWRQTTPAISGRGNTEHTSHRVYVIRNYSDSPRRYDLTAQFAEPRAGDERVWSEWSHQTLASEDGMVTVGFKDNSGRPTGADWPGVSVHARWFRD
jgi:hypothetical protein